MGIWLQNKSSENNSRYLKLTLTVPQIEAKPAEPKKEEEGKSTESIEEKSEETKKSGDEDTIPPPFFTYVVHPGDTLIGISFKYDVPVHLGVFAPSNEIVDR